MAGRVFILLVCALLFACNAKKRTASEEKPEAPEPFDRASFDSVTPLMDGSAYAMTADSRLWYLRGNQAVRVTIIGDTSQKLPEFFEITPVLDGSAYLVGILGEGGLWHLRGERAEKVSETATFADAGKPIKVSDRAFYALYLSEQKKRREAEERAASPP